MGGEWGTEVVGMSKGIYCGFLRLQRAECVGSIGGIERRPGGEDSQNIRTQ